MIPRLFRFPAGSIPTFTPSDAPGPYKPLKLDKKTKNPNNSKHLHECN